LSPASSPAFLKRTAQATWFVWALATIAEFALILRIVAALIWGMAGGWQSPSDAPGILYDLSGWAVNDLNQASNLLVPYQGIGHVFDITALLLMIIVFFGALGLTKIMIWTARRLSG
jgi:hypothetical protein